MNKILMTHVSKTKPVLSLKECMAFCVDCIKGVQPDCQCSSFNIGGVLGSDQGLCEVNEKSHYSHPEDIVSKEGYQYYGLTK